jgi:hypothetical protein
METHMMNSHHWISVGLRWLLALVFTAAAGLKMGGVTAGGEGADTMVGALPVWGQWLLVAGELALAVWLVWAWQLRWAAFVTIGVLSTFMGAIIYEMGKPKPLSCGCLGKFSPPNLWYTLSGDAALLALAVGLYFAAWGAGGFRDVKTGPTLVERQA